MILLDVNVLVYAARADIVDHARYRKWLEAAVTSEAPFGLSDLALSGFLRVVTHPKIFKTPMPVDRGVAFAERLRERPNCVSLNPGPRHWDIFAGLCRRLRVRGPLVPDAYFAALAIEYGVEWITTDRDFARFPGLRWRHPLDE